MRGPSAKKASFKQQTSTLNPTRALVSQPARTPPPALPTLQEEASGLKFAAAQAGRQALGSVRKLSPPREAGRLALRRETLRCFELLFCRSFPRRRCSSAPRPLPRSRCFTAEADPAAAAATPCPLERNRLQCTTRVQNGGASVKGQSGRDN